MILVANGGIQRQGRRAKLRSSFKQLRKGTRSVDREPDSRARSHRITGPGEVDVFGGHSKRFSSWLMNDNSKLPNEIAANVGLVRECESRISS